jgi:hypothetical protein
MVTLRNPQHGYEMVIKSWKPQQNKIESSITTIQIFKEKGGKKNFKRKNITLANLYQWSTQCLGTGQIFQPKKKKN